MILWFPKGLGSSTPPPPPDSGQLYSIPPPVLGNHLMVLASTKCLVLLQLGCTYTSSVSWAPFWGLHDAKSTVLCIIPLILELLLQLKLHLCSGLSWPPTASDLMIMAFMTSLSSKPVWPRKRFLPSSATRSRGNLRPLGITVSVWWPWGNPCQKISP